MAERKLNFNAPLLSVRRTSARTTSPDGEIAEKIENSNSRRNRFHTTASCKADSSLDLVTEPVAVPFHWEQIPGRRKNSSISNFQMDLDDKPEYQDEFRSQVEANSFRETFERLNDKGAIDSENDDGDIYSDALDTLSVSGLSGLGNLAIVKPSGTFATDPQIRDFMMSRFLPAAKAMTLEQPQRNKPVSSEQPRQITNVRKPFIVRNESLPIVPYCRDVGDEHSEDGGDEYCDVGNITTKGCGLLPRLCVKNSLCLLNPVPVMKVRTQNSLSKSRDAHGAEKIHKAAFAKSQSPNIKRENDARSPKNMVASGSNRFSIASSTMRLRRSGVISPYRNEAPQRQGFQGVAKEHESFKSNKWNSYSKVYSKSPELVPYYSIRRASRTRPVSPTVEKTLSVDTVNVAGILSSHSSDSKALVCVNAKASNNNVNTTRDRILNDGIENAKISLVLCPPSPLLPKTPSESWLWRTLPSISSHSLLNRGINFQSKRHDPCISSANTKWESIVKSSYLHHDHVRYSEELLPHNSQHSKS